MELEKKIKSMSDNSFENFCKNYWVECNVERKAYNEKPFQYTDYLKKNLQFLYDEFKRQNT